MRFLSRHQKMAPTPSGNPTGIRQNATHANALYILWALESHEIDMSALRKRPEDWPDGVGMHKTDVLCPRQCHNLVCVTDVQAQRNRDRA